VILKALRLRNFRRFADVSVEFPDGVTGVLGLNGVGKSSVFEAMAWALYGPVASRTSIDEIKRQGAAAGDPCRVEFEFVFDEHLYRVVREMVGKHLSSAATVTVDGKLAASGADAVSRFVQGRLGMDCKSFYTSIFAKQKELNALSSMNPSERRPLILRMLGISLLDAVVAQIRADTRDRERGMETVSRELVDESGGKVLDRLQVQRQQIEERKATLQLRISDENQAVKDAEGKHAESVTKCQAAKAAYEEGLRQREAVEQQKHAFERLQRLKDDEKTLTGQVADRQQKQQVAVGQLLKYKTLDHDISEVDRSVKGTAEKNEELLRAIEQKKTLIRRCEQDQREAEKKKAEIRRIGPDAKCPTCERELGRQYSTLIQHYDEVIKTAETQIADYRKESVALEREQSLLEKQRQALEKKLQYLHTQRLGAEAIKTTIRNIEIEIKREQQRLTALATEISGIGVVSYSVREHAAAVKKAKEAYEKYQKTLDVQNVNRGLLEKRRLQLQKCEGEAGVLAEQERAIQERIAHQESLQRQLQDMTAEKQRLSMLGEVMSGFRTHLISQIRPTLSAYASDLLSQLSDGKYTVLEFDDDYNISVYDNGEAFGIERFSGGEEDLANLCTRLAISEIITERAGSDFNFVVLDEIFGSQDSGRRQNILKALSGFSAKFRQIFLITHIEDIKNSVEHVISISEGEDGVSTLTVD